MDSYVNWGMNNLMILSAVSLIFLIIGSAFYFSFVLSQKRGALDIMFGVCLVICGMIINCIYYVNFAHYNTSETYSILFLDLGFLFLGCFVLLSCIFPPDNTPL